MRTELGVGHPSAGGRLDLKVWAISSIAQCHFPLVDEGQFCMALKAASFEFHADIVLVA